jgi:hypothetical protein
VTRSRSRTAIAVASLLALGAAAGITIDRMLHRRPHDPRIALSEVSADPLAAIDRVVNLRPEQRTRVAAILESRQDQIDAVWHDTHTRLLGTLDSLVEEIAAVLDADQAERFRAHARELHGDTRQMQNPLQR